MIQAVMKRLGLATDEQTSSLRPTSYAIFVLLTFPLIGACALTATRPVQDMSKTAAAIRAAREVRADTLAPELFRVAKEWFYQSRKEYRLKNFKEAKIYSVRSRQYAERAEFQALLNGGNRNAELQEEVDPYDDEPSETTQSGDSAGMPDSVTYESAVEQRQADAEARRIQQQNAAANKPPSQ